MAVILNLFENATSIAKEMSNIFDFGDKSEVPKETQKVATNSPEATVETTKPKDYLPPLELFGSISSITIDIYSRLDSNQIRPVLLLSLIQPSCLLTTTVTAKFDITLQSFQLSTSIKSQQSLHESLIPQVNDYDFHIISSNQQSNEGSNSLDAAFKASLILENPKKIEIDLAFGKLIIISLNLKSINNIMQLFEILPNPVISGESETVPDNVTSTSFGMLEAVHLYFATKALITTFTGEDGMSITGGYQQLSIDTQLKHNKSDFFDITSNVKLVGLDLKYTSMYDNYIPLLRPTQMDLEINATRPYIKR